MQVGDLVRIKRVDKISQQSLLNKLAIVVVSGTWSVDIRVLDNGANPRIPKEDCEVISESR